MKTLIVLACMGLVLAPWPRGIALNHQTRECGSYWAGDEYGSSSLPEGWEDFYPKNDGIIDTEIGSCYFGSARSAANAESCCNALGYTYVGAVGDARISPLVFYGIGYYLSKGLAVCCGVCCGAYLLLALVFVVGILLIRRRRKSRKALSA